jgi:KTSC domain
MPSAVIRDFSYNVATRQLVVTFVTGRVYAYAEVPPDVHNAFRASGSKGRFFNLEIRDHYDCREITSRDARGNAQLRMAPDHKTASRR